MKTLALIEDNPDNRMLIHAILAGAYEIQEYETGIEGLAGVREKVPDLVLLDISLPGMDGSEVIKEIRADQNEELRDLPVIALTAHAMAGDRHKFLEMGFNEYVTKPIVDTSALTDTIEFLLKLDK